MPMSCTQLAAGSANTNNNQTTHAGNSGSPAAGDLLIAIVQVSGNTVAGSMSGTWRWTFLTSFTKNSGADTVYIYWAYASAATLTAPVYNISGNSTGSAMIVLRLTGLEGQQVPSVRQMVSAVASTANPAVTLNYAVNTNNGVIGIATNTTNSSTQWTMPTGWTAEVTELAYNTPGTSLQVCYRTSGETGRTITWTNANTTAWGVMVIEFWVPRFRSTGGGMALLTPSMY